MRHRWLAVSVLAPLAFAIVSLALSTMGAAGPCPPFEGC
jgi:hypothetical protein